MRTQWEVNQHSEMELHAKLGASEDAYNQAMAELGSREVRRSKRLELWRERQKTVRQLNEREIWQSDLAEDEKEHLARAWEETLDVERQRDRKEKRNDVVRDYYHDLYQRSRDAEDERKR